MAKNVKQQLPALLSGVEQVTPELFALLLIQTGTSESYLKKLLREQPVPLHPLIEGVRQDHPQNLTRTLNALATLYATQPKPARATVLESKRHTLLALRRNSLDPWRNLVLQHLNTWLENPDIYPLWAQLQKQNAANCQVGGVFHSND